MRFQREKQHTTMDCAFVCPDGTIPNSVHEIHDLLLTAIRGLKLTDHQKDTMAGYVFDLKKGALYT